MGDDIIEIRGDESNAREALSSSAGFEPLLVLGADDLKSHNGATPWFT